MCRNITEDEIKSQRQHTEDKLNKIHNLPDENKICKKIILFIPGDY